MMRGRDRLKQGARRIDRETRQSGVGASESGEKGDGESRRGRRDVACIGWLHAGG